MILTCEAKIYPNKTQDKKLLEIIEGGRLLYNKILEKKISTYKETGENLSRYDLQKAFNGDTSIPATYRQVLIYRVDLAFKRFFKFKKGFPRFKSENRMRSIELRQNGCDYKIKDGKLHTWKILGSFKMRGFRDGNIHGMARIVRRDNKWYFQYHIEVREKKQRKTFRKKVGLDMGIISFLADSNGKIVKTPDFSRNARNRRKDFLHKLSRYYADNYDFIGVEDLKINMMVRDRRFSKGISNAAWATFFQMLFYKMKILGKVMVKVDPKGTSQACLCGNRVPKDVSVRVHKCDKCGLEEDRDIVSAKLIKKIAWDGRLALLGN